MRPDALSEEASASELLLDMLSCAARTASTELDYSPTLLRSAWIEHIPLAFWVVGAMRPRSIVELGTHWGTSYFAFCRAVQELGLDAKCHAVDTWRGDPHAHDYGEEVFESVNRINDREFASFSTLVRSTFAEAAERFPPGSIDLLHIDGFHTYEAVRGDFETWCPKLSGRGIVLLHDSQERMTDFGVWRLAAELAAEYPVFEFVHGHGLAVVGMGSQVPARIQALLALPPHSIDAAAVRQLWAMQGRRAAGQMASKTAQEGVEEALRERIVATEQTFDGQKQDLVAEVAALKARLKTLQSERDEQLRDLRIGLQQNFDARVRELHQQITRQLDNAARESTAHARAEISHGVAVGALADARRENAILNARLEALLSSTSWRSTALLRAMVDAAKGTAKQVRPSTISEGTQATNGPLRVLMVGHALDLTGAPHSQFEIAAGLKRRHLADPVIVSTADGPLRQRYEAVGIQVHVIGHPLANAGNPVEYRGRVSEISAWFRELRGTVVHSNTLQTFWAVDAASAASIPAIWNIRESEPWQTYFDWLPPSLRSCAYACFERARRVVFVSNTTREAWAPLELDGKYMVIHNGLDLPAFDARLKQLDRDQARQRIGAVEADVVIALVGTVTDRKGQLDLVRAAALLGPELARRCQIYIVGDRPGAYSEQVHQAAAELPSWWDNRLHVVPETEAVPVYLRAADIAACCSRIESYPRVVLEAMAASLPIITTPAFGIIEQVRAGENAAFYNPGDERELSGALTRMIEDPEGRRRMGDRSRAILQELTSYEQMIEQYAAVLHEACGTQMWERVASCAVS